MNSLPGRLPSPVGVITSNLVIFDVTPTSSLGSSPRRFFEMADRREKSNAQLRPLLIGPFIPKEIWRAWRLFKRIRKGSKRLHCSSVQAMVNHAAVNDSKGESFPLQFNSDVTYATEVEIIPRKYNS